MFVFVSVCLVAALLAYGYSRWLHTYWKRKGVPQIDAEFFYGSVQDQILGKKSLAETYYEFYQTLRIQGKKFGGCYGMYQPIFLPIDPELVKQIVQKDFEYFTAHFPAERHPTISSKNLFNLQGDEWRQTRKKLTPTFTSGKMKMMFETLVEKTTGLKELVGEVADSGQPLKIKETLERFTTDVIGSIGFGLECNSMKDPQSEFLQKGRKIFENEGKPGLFLLLKRLAGFGRSNSSISHLEQFFKKVVSETINYRETNQIYRKDFMHLMIQLKNQGSIVENDQTFKKNDSCQADLMTHDDITAQCLIFFVAGFETSATTMSYALLELAQHEDIQEKMREEVEEVLKKHDGKITYEAIMDLKYTETVIEETLRKYPPVAVLPRVCTRNYRIPGTDVTIEKGTPTLISALGLQKDPEYFPNPEIFNPDRFSAANKDKIRDFTYIPFGEGPRMCLGLRFGMMQSKAGLATVIRNFKVTLNKNTFFPLTLRKNTFITTVDADVWLNVERVKK